MEYGEWEPYYLEIARDFGYSPEEDAVAGQVLAKLLASRRISPIGPAHLRSAMRGKTAVITGPAAPRTDIDGYIIAADSSVGTLLEASRMPDLIVSDLDGDMDAILHANAMGVPVLVHAHGDNTNLLRRYVPAFRGNIGGTVQTEPIPPLMNFGGFTDGDRAVFIADAMSAERIVLTGFDFENPVEKAGMPPDYLETKKRKLEWARRLISMFEVEMV